MTQKILFLVLIGSTVVYCNNAFDGIDIPSLIEQEFKNIGSEFGSKKFEGLRELLTSTLLRLIQKITEGLPSQDPLEFSLKIDTKEYREAVAEIPNILKKIYDEKTPTLGEEDRKAVLQEVAKVAVALEKLVDSAIKNVKEKNPKQADATEFKKAIDNLNTFIDKIYAKQ